MMKLIQDLGMRRDDKGRTKRWGIYECSTCGIHKEYRTETVKTRNQEQCKICCSSNKNKKHGMRGHRLNSILNNMIQRCENPSMINYEYYGGKGISVCEEWKTNRASFFDWALSNGYEDSLTIDRINGSRNYEPSNCRFVPMTIQNRNKDKPKTNTSGYKGVCFKKRENKWAANIRCEGKQKHLGYFDSAEEAFEAYKTFVIENNMENKL